MSLFDKFINAAIYADVGRQVGGLVQTVRAGENTISYTISHQTILQRELKNALKDRGVKIWGVSYPDRDHFKFTAHVRDEHVIDHFLGGLG